MTLLVKFSFACQAPQSTVLRTHLILAPKFQELDSSDDSEDDNDRRVLVVQKEIFRDLEPRFQVAGRLQLAITATEQQHASHLSMRSSAFSESGQGKGVAE